MMLNYSIKPLDLLLRDISPANHYQLRTNIMHTISIICIAGLFAALLLVSFTALRDNVKLNLENKSLLRDINDREGKIAEAIIRSMAEAPRSYCVYRTSLEVKVIGHYEGDLTSEHDTAVWGCRFPDPDDRQDVAYRIRCAEEICELLNSKP